MLPCVGLFAVIFYFTLKENLDLICYNKCSFSEKLLSQKGKFSMLNRQIVVMWC